MSFFDDDEPPTRTSRPRRGGGATAAPGGARPPATPGGGGGGAADQQLLVRRAIALGLAVLLLILLVIGFNSCRTNARKDGLRDYNKDVSALVNESDEQVGQELFRLFGGDRPSPVELETQINQLRVRAEDQAKRAKGFDVRDEVVDAQRNLLLALNFRTEALGAIADRIRTALSDGSRAEEATNQIAGQMQKLLASDIVYSQRVAPLIKEALDDNDIAGQRIQPTRFLPNLGWLDPDTVARRIGGRASDGGRGGPVAPGSHGHGLTSVTVGEQALDPSPAANRIPAASNLAFDVAFQNQGDNDESDVVVNVRITGGSKPITARKAVNQTRAGANAEVSVPLGQAPPIGTPVEITVAVAGVPGEKMTDNNRQTYTAIFTR